MSSVGSYLAWLEGAVRATAIQSATGFSWFGRSSTPLPDRIRRALPADTARSYLLYNLQARLYASFYCMGVATPWKRDIGSQSITGMTPFVERLSAANSGVGYWAGGWQVQALEGDRVVVEKLGVSVWARPEDCSPATGHEDANSSARNGISPGTPVSLRFPGEAIALSPGYYMALADKRLRGEDAEPLVRFYWHLDPWGAESLMRAVTTALNEASLPFRLKVLNDRARYARCDAGVLYVRKADYDAIATVIERVYDLVASNLLPRAPAFTKQIAPGLGFAEDPGGAQSFGHHRCHILADGIIRAYEAGNKSLGERMLTVEERFAQEGIDLRAPFLNPGSSDVYTFPLGPIPHPAGASGERELVYEDGELLETALAIGRRICRDAIWYEDLCNWMGAQADEEAYLKGLPGVKYRALGPDLYDGTAGIALFLAALYSLTGDAEVGRTALGAVRHALSRLDDVPAVVRFGLYSGWAGIALATSRVACYLGDEALAERASALLKRCAVEIPAEHELDLLSGSAGGIVALLSFAGTKSGDDLLDFAVRLGNDLLQKAQVTGTGYSWRSLLVAQRRNLTGFSHGTAGIGYALLKLYQATGDQRYRVGAERAFQYERSWFDEEESNWPDFRERPGQDRRPKVPPTFVTAWCHGAPGIALSRLDAYRVLGDVVDKAEALTALETTAHAVEESLVSGVGGFSLCHGLAGNADILRTGSEMLGQDQGLSAWTDVPLRVARTGMSKYAAPGHTWPSGVAGGETPSLMLGRAGIGYFYLRLHDPSIPSILLI
jgi:hypothetical protein